MTDDELSKMLGDLDRRCKAAGSDTPTGSRLSMLHQQLQSYQNSRDPSQKRALVAFMARASTELAQIDVDGGEYIEAHHRPHTGQ